MAYFLNGLCVTNGRYPIDASQQDNAGSILKKTKRQTGRRHEQTTYRFDHKLYQANYWLRTYVG